MIFEVDEVEGQSFIAMEFIEGQSLKTKIESGPLKLDEALIIAMQVAEGLPRFSFFNAIREVGAHEKGAIH